MNVLIIGAGRMGIRHATGALQAKNIKSVTISDINEVALISVRNQLQSESREKTLTTCLNINLQGRYDIVIIAATASEREKTIKLALSFEPRYILIEKPLAQSMSEVLKIESLVSEKQVKTFVNLNYRMYPFICQLKSDLDNFPQFNGTKTINFSGGALGIGANGIHYLDILFFLHGADRAEIAASEIEPTIIPSGRGSSFSDFGGWCCIKFYNKNIYLGKSLFSLSSESSTLGGWDIIGSHGRILINEGEGTRTDILRIPDSQMPVNRYGWDYLPAITSKIEAPLLSDLTCEWLEGLEDNRFLLSELEQSIKVHKLMFDWLAKSSTHEFTFPIT